MSSQVSETWLITQLVPVSPLHWALTITHFFILKISMDPITIKIIHAKRQTDKNGIVSYDLKTSLRGENHVSITTHSWVYMRNNRALLHLVHTAKYNKMNDKRPLFPLVLYVHAITYCLNCHNHIPITTHISHILLWYNIRRHFWATLSDATENIKNKLS